MADLPDNAIDPDFAEHYETYNGFVKYGILFVAHVAAILALLAYCLT